MKELFKYSLLIILTLQFGVSQAILSVLKWNKNLGDFEPLPGVPSWDSEKDKRVLSTRNEETHNFKGQVLNLTYYEERGFFHFYDNDTKATGLVGDIWTTLSKLLNFSLVVTRSRSTCVGTLMPDGTFNGIFELLRLNQTDVIPKMEMSSTHFGMTQFTPIFWMNKYVMLIREQWVQNRTWMFDIFSTQVWMLIFIYILTLSLARSVTEIVRVPQEDTTEGRHRLRSYADNLLYTFAMVCNQGSHLAATRPTTITVTISLFSGLILTAYSSRLISSITMKTFHTPFADLTNLKSGTDLEVVVMNGSICHFIFVYYGHIVGSSIYKANRLSVVSDLDDLYNKICLKSDRYALCDGLFEVAGRGADFCNLTPVGPENLTKYIASGISRTVKNKRSLDIGIIKLFEFGIIKALKKRYLFGNEEAKIRNVDSLAISVNQIYFVLAILGLGIIASIVVCIAENIVFALKIPKSNRHLVRRCRRIANPRPVCIARG